MGLRRPRLRGRAQPAGGSDYPHQPPYRGTHGSRSWLVAPLLAVTLGVTALGSLAYLVENRATAAVRNEARQSLSATTSLTALVLEEQMNGIAGVLESYARRRPLVQALGVGSAVNRRELDRHLSELQRSRPDALTVAAVTDLHGKMLAVPGAPGIVGRDFSTRDWYRGVTRTGRTYVSEAFAAALPGTPLVVSVATPVRDARQRTIAVLVVGYTLEDFQAFVARHARKQDADITITDQRGVVIARPGPPLTRLTSLRADERVRAALAGRSSTSDGGRNAAGQRVLSAYAPATELGWAVVAEVPRAVAFAQVTRLREQVRGLTTAIAGLIVLGGALLARALRARDRSHDQAQRLASINAAVLEASREGIALVDRSGRTLLRNARMTEIAHVLGVTGDGDTYAELLRISPTMEQPEAFADTAEALRSDRELELDDEFTIAESGRTFHRYSRPVRTPAGERLGRVFVLRETTAERAADVLVQEARVQAEQASSAKSEFLSRMSHELRTPLHAILGFGELLERDGLTPTQQANLDQMTNGGRHLLNLINEVLDIERIERGELNLSPAHVALAEVADEVLALVTPLAAARSVRLQPTRLAEPGAGVLADRQHLKQVLLNLVSNAVKYNREGGSVVITGRPAGAGITRIEVTDTGPGIAAHQVPLLFGEFERLGAETTDVEGSGLGLALSKRIIEAMGGRIGVDTESGKGSTFWFELPAASTDQVADPEPAPEEVGPSMADAGPTTVRRVLLVEDNPANIRLVEAILLARPAVELLVATTAVEGLALARTAQPDLVLLDLNLPDLSGADVLDSLRSDDTTTHLPVVMVTADATPGETQRLLAAGAAGYLTKPFAVAQLLALVDGPPDAPPQPAGPEQPAALADGLLDPATLDVLHELGANPNVGPSGLHELVRVFCSDAAGRLERLRAAVQQADRDVLAHEAHTLRGGSVSIGAVQVAGICSQLEQANRRGDLAACGAAVDDLGAALAVAQAALAAEFGVPAEEMLRDDSPATDSR